MSVKCRVPHQRAAVVLVVNCSLCIALNLPNRIRVANLLQSFFSLVQIISSDHILWHFVFAIKSLICHLKLLNLIFISLFAKEKSPRPSYQLKIKISNHVNKNAGYFV